MFTTQLALWQPVTYMFLHGGIGHLLFNMLALWMFGTELERTWGTRFFVRYYMVTGIGAALVTVAWSLSPLPYATEMYQSVVIGASGAIYGLLLAYGMYFPTREIYLYFLFPIQARYFVMIAGAHRVPVVGGQFRRRRGARGPPGRAARGLPVSQGPARAARRDQVPLAEVAARPVTLAVRGLPGRQGRQARPGQLRRTVAATGRRSGRSTCTRGTVTEPSLKRGDCPSLPRGDVPALLQRWRRRERRPAASSLRPRQIPHEHLGLREEEPPGNSGRRRLHYTGPYLASQET